MKHEFALYSAELSKLTAQKIVRITDGTVLMRIHSVLRLQPGETCILFDEQVHARCKIQQSNKKFVELELIEIEENQRLQPEIICLLPLLKRDDLEIALYACVELGATRVQLVLTEKVQRAWGDAKEFERLQRIMIAAAEQSKNFALPALHAPVTLSHALAQLPTDAQKIMFDVAGQPALPCMQQLANSKPHAIAMIVGPEGDLTVQEKSSLVQQQCIVCELTPTVLRAASAFAVGLGMLRSCLK